MNIYGKCPETPNSYTGNVTCDNTGYCPHGQPCEQVVKQVCDWCTEEDEGLVETDIGLLCEQCIRAIKSRGEVVERK